MAKVEREKNQYVSLLRDEVQDVSADISNFSSNMSAVEEDI